MTGGQRKKESESFGDIDHLVKRKITARKELLDWEIKRSQGMWVEVVEEQSGNNRGDYG